jgi:acetyl esterase
MNVEDARIRSERSGAAFGAGAPEGSVKTSDKMLQLPHTLLKCRVYTCVGNDAEVASSLPQALLMWVVVGVIFVYVVTHFVYFSYFHGGGWTVGSIESHDGVCQLLAFQNRMSVVSVAYRLAPDHPFPCAVDDAIASCSFILDQLRHSATNCDGIDAAATAASWGVTPGAIVGVGGDSAGGTLAAVAAQHLRKCLSFQLLVYPFTDGCRANASDAIYTSHVLTPQVIDWFQLQYVGPVPPIDDARYAPLRCSNFSALPPALLVLAECDPLFDHGVRYARALRDGGGHADVVVARGALHAFFHLQKFYTAAAASVMPQIQSWLRDRLQLEHSE